MIFFRKFFYKVIFTLYKNIPVFRNSMPKIRSGFLKDMYWSLKISGTSYLIGDYEEDALKKLQELLKPTGVVYDIGANAGYFSLAASKIIGDQGKVIAFEPMPENLELLEKHFEINNINNVQIVPKAVSDKNGTITFTHSKNLAANTYVTDSPMFNIDKNRLEVETITIDQFVESSNDDALPSLIKIDVEGAEFDVLLGAKKTLTRLKPIILLATHDNHLPGVKDKCLNILKPIGYKIVEIDENKIPGQEDFYAIHPENSDYL